MIDLPAGWSAVGDPAVRAGLEAELRREVPAAHGLYGLNATALARDEGSDDVLFALADGRVALVHLTWRAEASAEWPAAAVFATVAEWRAGVA